MDILALPAEPASAEGLRREHQPFAAFYGGTWPDLAGFCVALVRDEVAGEEIAQEAMTRVFVRYPLLRDARAYAFRIATNLARRHWRDRQRELPVDSFAAFDTAAPAARDDAVLAAVRGLPPRLRDVVVLHYYADMRVEDVAWALRRPLGTVKRRLHEARAALARAMEEER